jgi:predicted Rossmann-fold nucleotide-binding protein
MPVVMVGKRYWERLIDFELLEEEGMIAPEDLELFEIVDSAEEAWEHIKKWHIKRKTHLYHLYREKGKKKSPGK